MLCSETVSRPETYRGLRGTVRCHPSMTARRHADGLTSCGPCPVAAEPCGLQHRARPLHRPLLGRRRHGDARVGPAGRRSEEHTSELQSLMRISYAVFCLTKKNTTDQT